MNVLRWASSFLFAFVVSIAPCLPAEAQVRHEVNFPDLPGSQTLICDFHMHTVFSDGSVWPTVRVAEAWRQGLDAIAITDHVEYQPHKADLPTNHNRPYELASGPAKTVDLLIARATEITRDTPPGHFNALFLDDVNPIDTKEFLAAIEEANKQEAFVVWNHHAWKGEELGGWLEVHTTMFDNKWFQGMEICNGDSYYPTAHKWCLQKNLTMMGNTDIHDADLRLKSATDDHRTMTLVFVKQRTLPALKEALLEGRTVVWFKDQLIGRKEQLGPLFDACVQVAVPHLTSGKNLWVKIHNVSDVDVELERSGGVGPLLLTLPARTTSLVRIITDQPAPLELQYKATNFLVGPEENLPVVLKIPAP